MNIQLYWLVRYSPFSVGPRFLSKHSSRHGKVAIPKQSQIDSDRVLSSVSEVDVQISTIPSQIRQKLEVGMNEDVVRVPVKLLKQLANTSNLSISLVDKLQNPPLFKFTTNHGVGKLGIRLPNDQKIKTIKLGVNIDDHMLGVRGQQADSFLKSGYAVMVIIKLSSRLLKMEDGQSIEEHERLVKLMYDLELNRFKTVFSRISAASLRVIERPKPTELVFLLTPTAEDHQP